MGKIGGRWARIRIGIDVLESGANLLQDGTARLWAEGTHLTGALFVNSRNALLLLDQ
jgi:hypothetical protein